MPLLLDPTRHDPRLELLALSRSDSAASVGEPHATGLILDDPPAGGDPMSLPPEHRGAVETAAKVVIGVWVVGAIATLALAGLAVYVGVRIYRSRRRRRRGSR